MKIFEKAKVIIERMVSISCDICGRTHLNEDNDSTFEIQEFVSIDFTAGYGSVIGDGNRVTLDICQHCFKEKFEKYYHIY
jgi:hypothetical protein